MIKYNICLIVDKVVISQLGVKIVKYKNKYLLCLSRLTFHYKDFILVVFMINNILCSNLAAVYVTLVIFFNIHDVTTLFTLKNKPRALQHSNFYEAIGI